MFIYIYYDNSNIRLIGDYLNNWFFAFLDAEISKISNFFPIPKDQNPIDYLKSLMILE